MVGDVGEGGARGPCYTDPAARSGFHPTGPAPGCPVGLAGVEGPAAVHSGERSSRGGSRRHKPEGCPVRQRSAPKVVKASPSRSPGDWGLVFSGRFRRWCVRGCVRGSCRERKRRSRSSVRGGEHWSEVMVMMIISMVWRRRMGTRVFAQRSLRVRRKMRTMRR